MMRMNVLYFVFLFIILITFLLAIVMLQIYLSQMENKWAGLILPTISAFSSGLLLIRMAVSNDVSFSYTAIVLFLIVPPVILLSIYLVCRKKFKSKKEIDKMNIQDLH